MTYRDEIRRAAAILARAIDTPTTGAALPTTALALHELARRLELMADGETPRKAFAPPARRRGRPPNAWQWFEYWRLRVLRVAPRDALKRATGYARFTETARQLAKRHRNAALECLEERADDVVTFRPPGGELGVTRRMVKAFRAEHALKNRNRQGTKISL